ncbi:MAG TPA: hypothetical protein VKQ08_01490 [Cyclobacteriaceae bacterium]|nr:hypothetical protein [Cyclobacteriaceae bacterium]
MRDLREYSTATFWREEFDDILFFKYSPKLEMDVDIAKEIVYSRLEYTQGKSAYALIDVTNLKSATKEARDYMNSVEGGLKGLSAGAFLSNSVVATLLVNLYLKVSNPPIPAKFFTTQREALNWLKKVRSEKNQFSAIRDTVNT